VLHRIRRRRHRVVVEDRSVAPVYVTTLDGWMKTRHLNRSGLESDVTLWEQCTIHRSHCRPELLLDYIESTIDEINQNFVGCNITLAGDFNQLSDREISERTGLTSIVHQPTRAANILDRIYVSHPRYSIVRVVSSVVKSDHQAVVAYSDSKRISIPKVSFQRTYRPVTPDQHAQFLRFISTIDINIPFHSDNTQLEFDNFYTLANGLLDIFYPTKTITVTSRDPTFITARIKGMLRHKNRLMRAGRTEKASAIAKRIGKCITSRNRRRLCSDGRKIEAKDMWAAVRQLTGHRQVPAAIEVSKQVTMY